MRTTETWHPCKISGGMAITLNLFFLLLQLETRELKTEVGKSFVTGYSKVYRHYIYYDDGINIYILICNLLSFRKRAVYRAPK